MTFSKEECDSSIQSEIIDIQEQDCVIKLTDLNISDSEDELRVEDISSSSFETSSDE